MSLCAYELAAKAHSKLKAYESLTLDEAIAVLRYTDPVPLPNGMTIMELLKLMKERGLIQYANGKDSLPGSTVVRVLHREPVATQ